MYETNFLSILSTSLKKTAFLIAISSFLILVACSDSPNAVDTQKAEKTRRVIKIGELISYKDIPVNYYEESNENKKIDPANALIASLRERKMADLKNPDAPPPFSDKDNQVPKRLAAANLHWNDLEAIFRFDWEALKGLNSEATQQLKQVVKAKVVLHHPDFKIIELAIGAGGVLPSHIQVAPSALHILEGSAEIIIDGKSAIVHTGTSIKLEGYSKRRIQVNAEKPLKALWFVWAPNGRQDYLNFGYYLTGCNFHAQPIEAVMPADFEFWKKENRQKFESNKEVKNIPLPNSTFHKKQADLLKSFKSNNDKTLVGYSATPLFSNELAVNWLDFTKIKGGFFWAKDAGKAKDLLIPWNKIARMKGIFQAKVPDGLYDFNMSYIALGPHGKYVTHSHATPEFYYVLGGHTEWILEGETFTATAGDVFFHSPYWNHEMKPLKSGKPLRAVTGSWAPFGDRTVFQKPFLLLEALPVQSKEAVIGDSFDFYDFVLMEDLEFEGD